MSKEIISHAIIYSIVHIFCKLPSIRVLITQKWCLFKICRHFAALLSFSFGIRKQSIWNNASDFKELICYNITSNKAYPSASRICFDASWKIKHEMGKILQKTFIVGYLCTVCKDWKLPDCCEHANLPWHRERLLLFIHVSSSFTREWSFKSDGSCLSHQLAGDELAKGKHLWCRFFNGRNKKWWNVKQCTMEKEELPLQHRMASFPGRSVDNCQLEFQERQ